MNKFIKYFPPGVLVISLMSVYLKTMAPGLTWANTSSDGGDLITAAATGGVAHPTGYPVYLLLARLFQVIPVGSLAFRTNLMSGLAAVVASLVIYYLVIHTLSPVSGSPNWMAGLASAYAFGFAPLIWSQAVVTEVYTLHALFVALILYLASDNLLLSAPKQLDLFLGLTFGLSMGNHVTSVLLLPVLLIPLIFRRQDRSEETQMKAHQRPVLSFLLRRLGWFGVGLLAYLTLPLRAMSQPPVNWGNPVTVQGFVWLVSGKLYQDQLFVLNITFVWLRVQAMAALLIEQFGIPGLVIGLMGLIVFFKSSSTYLNTAWIAFIYFTFAIVYATYDSFMYLIPVFLCFAIWIGLGLGGLLDLVFKNYPKIGAAVSLIFIMYLFVLTGAHWRQVDASRDLRAERFGRDVLAQAPANAIVFAKGDKAIFTMWYFHYALRNRPDLTLVVTDLLSFDWYQETLHNTYPNLELPGPFPFSETMAVINPSRPVCYIEYDQLSDIRCLPPKKPD